ncbi:arsinothricin resistance N-acetyltransferase ArsN1 family A [Macrococcoides canis]|uniref:arsinothricin resistance N-acetyltransferase ArsN1 family A n=1 Tax=Macrococcoides canis TaxID=1855823 RepID=UPI001B8DA0CC|nr:arsinothricin resistance N-acetyltransferase ArsN1 family A [Macrococcus canis]QUR94920.1 GNAT family N-acetyltransferase [Macrococcus canis]UTH06565.1 N-acetyltransferase [Macrococcus canis]
MIRLFQEGDITAIKEIYNQGVMTKRATLETSEKNEADIRNWLLNRDKRFITIVYCDQNKVLGFASISPYNSRCAYKDVAEVSIYIDAASRTKGIGTELLKELIIKSRENSFKKLVLFSLEKNVAGTKLYEKCGFRHVGIFMKHGVIDGVDQNINIMEQLL